MYGDQMYGSPPSMYGDYAGYPAAVQVQPVGVGGVGEEDWGRAPVGGEFFSLIIDYYYLTNIDQYISIYQYISNISNFEYFLEPYKIFFKYFEHCIFEYFEYFKFLPIPY